jgi:hypothetical protein
VGDEVASAGRCRTPPRARPSSGTKSPCLARQREQLAVVPCPAAEAAAARLSSRSSAWSASYAREVLGLVAHGRRAAAAAIALALVAELEVLGLAEDLRLGRTDGELSSAAAAIASRWSPSSRSTKEHAGGELGRGGDCAALVAKLELDSYAA